MVTHINQTFQMMHSRYENIVNRSNHEPTVTFLCTEFRARLLDGLNDDRKRTESAIKEARAEHCSMIHKKLSQGLKPSTADMACVRLCEEALSFLSHRRRCGCFPI